MKSIKKDKSWSFSNIKITQKLIGLLVGLLVGFVIIGLAYLRVLQAENEAVEISNKMVQFEKALTRCS